jgi:hypothetical protein
MLDSFMRPSNPTPPSTAPDDGPADVGETPGTPLTQFSDIGGAAIRETPAPPACPQKMPAARDACDGLAERST